MLVSNLTIEDISPYGYYAKRFPKGFEKLENFQQTCFFKNETYVGYRGNVYKIEFASMINFHSGTYIIFIENIVTKERQSYMSVGDTIRHIPNFQPCINAILSRNLEETDFYL